MENKQVEGFAIGFVTTKEISSDHPVFLNLASAQRYLTTQDNKRLGTIQIPVVVRGDYEY